MACQPVFVLTEPLMGSVDFLTISINSDAEFFILLFNERSIVRTKWPNSCDAHTPAQRYFLQIKQALLFLLFPGFKFVTT